MIIPRSASLRPEHAPMLLWLGMGVQEVMDGLGLTWEELVSICRRHAGAHPCDLRARGCRAEVRRMVRRMDRQTVMRVCGVRRKTLLAWLCA